MIRPTELISLFRKALDEQWGYIYGQSGQMWTEKKQSAATREQTVKYGAQWIGHRVTDCSGLFVWAFKQLGGTIYHGSNSMWNRYMSAKGFLVDGVRMDGKALKPGSAVFKVRGADFHHVGLYVGENTVIEAKGTASGVVTSPIRSWHAWGEMKDVEYSGKGDEGMKETEKRSTSLEAALGTRLLKRTKPYMRGDDVMALQSWLNELGFDCGKVDGIFGNKTKAAVISCQERMGLVTDGIAGPKTKHKMLL